MTGHVWFGVRVYGGGRGWRKSEKMPARRGCWRISVEIASFSSDFNGARQIKFRETLKWKCKCNERLISWNQFQNWLHTFVADVLLHLSLCSTLIYQSFIRSKPTLVELSIPNYFVFQPFLRKSASPFSSCKISKGFAIATMKYEPSVWKVLYFFPGLLQIYVQGTFLKKALNCRHIYTIYLSKLTFTC